MALTEEENGSIPFLRAEVERLEKELADALATVADYDARDYYEAPKEKK